MCLMNPFAAQRALERAAASFLDDLRKSDLPESRKEELATTIRAAVNGESIAFAKGNPKEDKTP